MTVPRLVIGAPVWQRSWSLPIWFESVRANCKPQETGLIFVVPPSDTQSREVIAQHTGDFAFVEVLRDRNEQFDREIRRRDNHQSLATARNMLLQHVSRVGPQWFLSWDSDFLVAPGVVAKLQQAAKPLTTVWAWLNRRPPQPGQHWDDETQRFWPVYWNEPVNQTAMRWEPDRPGVAVHLNPADWHKHAQGLWRCDVALAWQLMKAPVYSIARYGAHPHGEDLPFNWALEQRGIERWCYGQEPGVHLFDRSIAEREIEEGYPAIMCHATEDLPLAATHEPESIESLRTIGYYRRPEDPASASAA